jgi:hypothetical protein
MPPGIAPLRNHSKQLSYISDNVTAPVEQTLTHVSHPSHRSAWAGFAFPSFISNTLTGQLFAHSSHPSHFSVLTVTKYMRFLLEFIDQSTVLFLDYK